MTLLNVLDVCSDSSMMEVLALSAIRHVSRAILEFALVLLDIML